MVSACDTSGFVGVLGGEVEAGPVPVVVVPPLVEPLAPLAPLAPLELRVGRTTTSTTAQAAATSPIATNAMAITHLRDPDLDPALLAGCAATGACFVFMRRFLVVGSISSCTGLVVDRVAMVSTASLLGAEAAWCCAGVCCAGVLCGCVWRNCKHRWWWRCLKRNRTKVQSS